MTDITIHEHDAPETLFATLARVFGEHENDGVRWVTLKVDDVQLTFYACRTATESPEGALS